MGKVGIRRVSRLKMAGRRQPSALLRLADTLMQFQTAPTHRTTCDWRAASTIHSPISRVGCFTSRLITKMVAAYLREVLRTESTPRFLPFLTSRSDYTSLL